MDIRPTSYIVGAVPPEAKQAIKDGLHRFAEAFREAHRPISVPADVFVPTVKKAAEGARDAVRHVIEFVQDHPESLLM